MQIIDDKLSDRTDNGVALVSRLLKMLGLFCKRALQKRQYTAKETYNLIDPTDRSHPILRIHISIPIYICAYIYVFFLHISICVHIISLSFVI